MMLLFLIQILSITIEALFKICSCVTLKVSQLILICFFIETIANIDQYLQDHPGQLQLTVVEIFILCLLCLIFYFQILFGFVLVFLQTPSIIIFLAT